MTSLGKLTKTASKIRTNESLIISLTLSKQKKVSKIIKKQPLKYFIIVLRVQRVFKKKTLLLITYFETNTFLFKSKQIKPSVSNGGVRCKVCLKFKKNYTTIS